MKKTKKQPVIVAIGYPDGGRFEARVPLWEAYFIMAEIEREIAEIERKKELKSSPKEKIKELT